MHININMTQMGGIVFAFAIVIGILSYYLGKRKTSTPKLAAFVGFLLSFIPPLGLIYLAILLFKNDIDQSMTNAAAE